MLKSNVAHHINSILPKKIQFYKTSERFFMSKVLYTEIAYSKKYKNKFLNRFNATENSYVIFNSGNKQGDFAYSCLIFFILRQMTNRENCPVHIIGVLPNGKEIYMPTEYEEYVEIAKDVVALKTSFFVGEERVKYKFLVNSFTNITKVSIPAYHPEKLTSANIFGLLNQRINLGIRYLDVCDKQKTVDKRNCL